MMRYWMRKLLVPTMMTLAMLAVLLKLGFWQLERSAQKNVMLANLALPVTELGVGVAVSEKWELRRVKLVCPRTQSGIFTLRSASSQTPQSYAYCRMANNRVLVVRPASSDARQLLQAMADDGLAGSVRLWEVQSRIDKIAGVQKLSRSDFPEQAALLPVYMKTGPAPERKNIANNHLFYAVQWFAFAAVLAIIYGLYAWRLWRETAFSN